MTEKQIKGLDFLKLFENDLKFSHFGLRKSLVVRQKIKNKSVKSKVNISLLSRLEHDDLQQKLNISK